MAKSRAIAKARTLVGSPLAERVTLPSSADPAVQVMDDEAAARGRSTSARYADDRSGPV